MKISCCDQVYFCKLPNRVVANRKVWFTVCFEQVVLFCDKIELLILCKHIHYFDLDFLLVEYENVHFDWKEYLERNNAEAVPEKAFKPVSVSQFC